MRRYESVLSVMILAVFALCAIGCGDKQPVLSKKVFYPAPPNPPRLQFLLSFSRAGHWTQKKSSFADFVVGEQKVEAPDEIITPYGVACRDGKLYVCDLGRARVHVITVATGKYTTLGRRGRVKKPVNITIDRDGTRYVCDTGLEQVAVFDRNDKFVRYIGDPKTCKPIDLAVYGDELIVADVAGAEVEVWSKDGTFKRIIAHKGQGPDQLAMPTNLAVTSDGRVLVADTVASIINVYNLQGNYLSSIGAPGDRPGFFARPKGIAIAPSGIVYTVDAQWEVGQVFDPEGRLLMYFGGANTRPEGMGMPAGVAVDPTSVAAFKRYIDKDFDAEYIVFVANQFGRNKIGVYAFGKSRTAKYEKVDPKTSVRPSAAPGANIPAPKQKKTAPKP